MKIGLSFDNNNNKVYTTHLTIEKILVSLINENEFINMINLIRDYLNLTLFFFYNTKRSKGGRKEKEGKKINACLNHASN